MSWGVNKIRPTVLVCCKMLSPLNTGHCGNGPGVAGRLLTRDSAAVVQPLSLAGLEMIGITQDRKIQPRSRTKWF